MNHLSVSKTALAVGLFLSGWHLVWSLLVALGWGQPLLDFALWAHMIHIQFVIGPFELYAALLLIIVTFLIGCALGCVFAYLWNWLHRSA